MSSIILPTVARITFEGVVVKTRRWSLPGQSPDKILVMDLEQVAEFGEPERLFAQF
jgi:ABC-type multidrug transport system fused ATPase/permease subunit